jgi:hypothetical protein
MKSSESEEAGGGGKLEKSGFSGELGLGGVDRFSGGLELLLLGLGDISDIDY